MSGVRRGESVSSSSRDAAQPPNSQENLNIFSDEFAEDYAESIHAPSIHRNNSDVHVSSTGPVLAGQWQGRQLMLSSRQIDRGQRLVARDSVRKATGEGGDSDETGDDGVNQPHSAFTQRGHPGLTGHSPSSVSSFSFATTQNPFQGPNEPSQPYGMYPQGLGVSRSASIMTASTMAPMSHNMASRQGPAHPYGLYPQDISPVTSDSVQNHPVPVGFLRRDQHYRRRMGPEGEEQDIVGPDGHAEQLPPYSKYADDHDTKIAIGNPLPVIGEAERATSHDGLIEMQERPPTAPQTESTGPRQTASPAPGLEITSSTGSEKSWPERTWKEKRDTKLCGILPLWVLLAIIISIIVIAVVCGAVIGTFLAKTPQHPPAHRWNATATPHHAVVTTTVTTLVDASPTQIPTYLPNLSLGTHQVLLGDPDRAFDSCLTDTTQQPAWSCNLADSSINISIDILSGNYTASFSGTADTSAPQYGSLPPVLDAQSLGYVQDDDYPERGGAWHFQALYNKTVVVPTWSLGPSAKFKRYGRRSASLLSPQLFRRQVVTGETAWFCYWNQTFVDAFLYMFDKVDPKSSNASSSSSGVAMVLDISASAAQSLTTTSIPLPLTQSLPLSTPVTASPGISSTLFPSLPTSTALTTPTFPETTSTTSSAPWTGWTGYHSRFASNDGSAPASYQSELRACSTCPLTIGPRDASASASSLPTFFPQVIKVEERRLPNSPQAYCQEMQLLPSGEFRAVQDDKGNLIVITLSESSSAEPTSSAKLRRKRHSYEKDDADDDDDDSSNACFCRWESFSP